MLERLVIDRLGHEGDGIAETATRRIFVAGALPGETVSAEVEGETGRLVEILTASAERVAPLPGHDPDCGCCPMQHLASGPYLAWKHGLVVEALRQRGIEGPVDPIVPIGLGTRRRAVFTALRGPAGTVVGYNRRGTHTVHSAAGCPVLVPAIARRLTALEALAGRILAASKRARMTVAATDGGLDVAIEDSGRKLTLADREALGRLGEDGAIARLTVDREEVFLARAPEIAIGGASLFPAAGGFLQAAAPAEAAMVEAVLALAGASKKPMADLFAGIGTFTLRLAGKSPVTAVEHDRALLAALDRSVRHARGLKKITALRRDLFRDPLTAKELEAFGTVVFDPPRAGAKAVAEALALSKVERVVAVSCNPATFARDARILIDGGYRLVRVQPVDQFLWSGHVELVAGFIR